MQLIFLVESNKQSQSDYYYISETLKRFYDVLGHKLTPIFLEGKGNYNKKQVDIDKAISKYQGKTHVFICYDIDRKDNPSFSLNTEIESYATNNGFNTIWFYENIEQVYIKRDLLQSEKSQYAKQFVTKNSIEMINPIDLSQKDISRNKSSNILFVLDKFLNRK